MGTEKTTQHELAISVFKATCLERLETVRRTREPLLVTRRGEPVALIMPPPHAGSWLGRFADTARIVGDVVSPAADESDFEALAP
jgi:antitoxin (DNA-binding transcriptional repressor) of toxin-antitoxin stability system